MRKFIHTLLFFIPMFYLSVGAYSAPSNCTYDNAKFYFPSASVVLSEYSPSYYCSDISYLISSKRGNISLSEYEKLYPSEVQKNISYLRKIGLTPDLVNEYIDEDDYSRLATPNSTDDFIKSLVAEVRGSAPYVIATYKNFEANKAIFDGNKIGDILNKDKGYRSCSIIQNDATYSVDNSLYETDAPTYRKLISALPPVLSPVVLNGNKLENIFGETVATIRDNRALGKQTREVYFSSLSNQTTNIKWNNGVCKPKTIQEMVNRNSHCYLCPYIVMIFNEISYLFDYMYSHFSGIIVTFLFVFGCLFMVFEFFKGFKGLPFESDFSYYPKSIAKQLQKILVVCTLILVPPKILFSWTVEPVLNLTMAISDSVMQVGTTSGTRYSCDGASVVDKINAEHRTEQNETAVPPIIKVEQAKSLERLQNSSIISKDTMGNIVCFLTNTLEANGRQMTMGEVLVRDLFNFSSKSEHKFLGFVFGVVIFGLYFSIGLMISFYVLDGLLDFLKLAIIWPFAVFGYAFNIVGISTSIKSIIEMARKFGLTMINLAVFALFNSALLNSFYFVNTKENILQILNRAIEQNDTSIITDNIPVDLLSVSKFLFIVYCIYYVYNKLGEFASSYGISSGGISLGKNIKNIVLAPISLAKSVTVGEPKFKKKEEKKDKAKSTSNGTDDKPDEETDDDVNNISITEQVEETDSV